MACQCGFQKICICPKVNPRKSTLDLLEEEQQDLIAKEKKGTLTEVEHARMKELDGVFNIYV